MKQGSVQDGWRFGQMVSFSIDHETTILATDDLNAGSTAVALLGPVAAKITSAVCNSLTE